MNKIGYLSLWGGIFVICAGLGFVPSPEGVLKWMLVMFSVAFFAPPGLMLWDAVRKGDKDTVKLVRNLAALSLGATVVVMILNILSIQWSEAVGNGLYALLIVVSCPMACAQYGLLSLFLWACLLMVSIRYLRQQKKR